MTEPAKPKVSKPDGEKVTEIIELVDVIDWRYVALAFVVGGIAIFALLAIIEHTDDAQPPIFDGD